MFRAFVDQGMAVLIICTAAGMSIAPSSIKLSLKRRKLPGLSCVSCFCIHDESLILDGDRVHLHVGYPTVHL